MEPQDLLEWCYRNHATVWFLRDVVKVKVKDFSSAIKGQSLSEAIANIERLREGRKIMTSQL